MLIYVRPSVQVFNGSSMGLQWVFNGSSIGLQWAFNGSSMGLQRVFQGSSKFKGSSGGLLEVFKWSFRGLPSGSFQYKYNSNQINFIPSKPKMLRLVFKVNIYILK